MHNIWYNNKKIQIIEKTSVVDWIIASQWGLCPIPGTCECRDVADVTKDFEMERVSWLMQVGPYEREGQSQ